MVDKIIPNNAYQYYFLGNLWQDIQKVMNNNIRMMNFNSEPILTSEILERFFPDIEIALPTDTPVLYDYYTKNAVIFDNNSKYTYSKLSIFVLLAQFI